MTRKDQRRKSSKALKGMISPPSDIANMLALAIQHHNGGRLSDAERLYRQVLQSNPTQPDALFLLGRLALQSRRPLDAIDLLSKAHSVVPDNIEVMLVLAHALKASGRLDDSAHYFRKAIKNNINEPAPHFGLGLVLSEGGDWDAAEASYRKALECAPEFVDAFTALGNLYTSSGRLEEAVDAYDRALELKPDLFVERRNMATALRVLGRSQEALQLLEAGLSAYPNQHILITAMMDLLNLEPSLQSGGAFVAAQMELSILSKPGGKGDICDAAVVDLWQASEQILKSHEISELPHHASQIWRGRELALDCERHKQVFNRYGVIPEYCYGCFKVTLDVPRVIDLIKVVLSFEAMSLPQDNMRKCHVELRPNIPGFYKGLVYCSDLNEAETLAEIVRAALAEHVGPEAIVKVKRGCLEYTDALPEYGHFDEGGQPVLEYDPAGRKAEDAVDQMLSGRKFVGGDKNFNHPGLSVSDALIIRTWLSYAATIGDESYQLLTSMPLRKMNLKGRPPYRVG